MKKSATLTDAIAALERHVGFRRGRLRAVSQRLQQAGMIPTGGPRTAPQLGICDVVSILIAYAADAPLHVSPRSAETYGAMTPAGAAMPSGPVHLRTTADEKLHALAELAVDGDPNVRASKLEFVSSWPEFCLHYPNGDIQRYRPAGTLPSHWGAYGHRQSMTVNGAAFADVFKEIFA